MSIFNQGGGAARNAVPDGAPGWLAFQELASRRVEEDYPPPSFRHERNSQREVLPTRQSLMRNPRGSICPDHVVRHVPLTGEARARIVLVADAKLRRTLAKGDVEVVLDYAVALDAEHGCRIYVPADCDIQPGALGVEHADYEIHIVRDIVGTRDEIDPDLLLP